jgi:hypothetical protein
MVSAGATPPRSSACAPIYTPTTSSRRRRVRRIQPDTSTMRATDNHHADRRAGHVSGGPFDQRRRDGAADPARRHGLAVRNPGLRSIPPPVPMAATWWWSRSAASPPRCPHACGWRPGRGCVRGRTSRSCARATRTSSGWSRARRTSHGVRGLTRRDHARQALHKRPDRMVVGGEVHGAEVCDLAQVLRRRCCWRAVAGVVDRPDLGIGGWGGPRAVVPCSGTGPAGLACE